MSGVSLKLSLLISGPTPLDTGEISSWKVNAIAQLVASSELNCCPLYSLMDSWITKSCPPKLDTQLYIPRVVHQCRDLKQRFLTIFADPHDYDSGTRRRTESFAKSSVCALHFVR